MKALFGGALYAAGLVSSVANTADAQCAAQVVDSVPADAYGVFIPGYPAYSTSFQFRQLEFDSDRIVALFRTDAYSGPPNYVRRAEDSFLTFDTSDPADLQPVGRWDIGREIDDEIGIGLAGDVLAVPSSAGGVDLYDFSDPNAPTLVNQLVSVDNLATLRRLSAWGNKVIVAGEADTFDQWRVAVIDVSEPTAPMVDAVSVGPVMGSSPDFTTPIDGVLPVFLSDRVTLIDVRGAEPVVLGVVAGTFSGPSGAIVRDTLVLRDSAGELPAFDISDPANPVPLPTFVPPDMPQNFTSFEQLVTFSRVGANQFYVADYTDPANPFVASVIDVGTVSADAVADDRGFVFRASFSQLEVIATGDCATPTIRSLSPGGATTVGGDPLVLHVDQINGSSFQWMLDGGIITDGPLYSGTTTPTLTVSADLAAAGLYSVVVSNTGSSTIASESIVAIRGSDCGVGDTAAPFGLLDLGDIDTFIASFISGCP